MDIQNDQMFNNQQMTEDSCIIGMEEDPHINIFQNFCNNNVASLSEQKQKIFQQQKEIHSLEILQMLQQTSQILKQIINTDLHTLGVQLENIAILNLFPSTNIKKELDKQTQTRIDGKTNLIQAMLKKKQIDTQLQMEYTVMRNIGTACAKIEVINAAAVSEALYVVEKGEKDRQELLNGAWKQEAGLLQDPLASDLAILRQKGDSGSSIYQQQSQKQIFGQGPYDILHTMFDFKK